MSSPSPAPVPPRKRVRLLPWRGPVHFLLLLVTSSVSLLLPLLYVALLGVLALFIALEAHAWVSDLAAAEALGWRDALPAATISAGVVTWLFMLRPLLPNPRSTRVALQITPASQPGVFELVDELCWHLNLDPVEELWLDTTAGIRTTVKDGMTGVSAGQMVMHIGLPVVSVTSARELAALLVRELAMNAGGIGTTFSHLLRELNNWFYRALHERDAWELDLRRPRAKESPLRKTIRLTTWMWMGVAKVPFAVLFLMARIISAAALLRLRSGAEAAARNLVGAEQWRALNKKMSLLDKAWEDSRKEIQRGMVQQRLPENLSLLLARHVARAARDLQAAPGAARQEQVPKGEPIIASLPRDAPAATQFTGFVDLSRQVTFFYYQHELGLSLHEHRLVAEEEVIHQNRQQDESLVVIRRYFNGLAHPERAMCGLGGSHAACPGRPQLEDEILRVREEMREWGSRLKMSLKEWNMAWQRRRDLEAAAILSQAGFSVSRIQFGTEDTSPQSLRAEAARQRLVMEQLESPIQALEVRMESRFAAALGLLWWSDPAELDETLALRRGEMALWCALYESMAGALPSFRELLTVFFGFQTLGARFANTNDNGQLFTALQSVVPKMTNLVRQILGTLDGAVYPFTPHKRPIPLGDHLLQGRLPEPAGISMNPGAAVDMRAMAAEMAATSSEVIAPFVDRYLQLYHKAYAWLAETAERTENRFLSPMSLGADIELLMPEEFAKSRETQPLRKPLQAA